MKAEQGRGMTIPLVNRRTCEISGWKAVLPREHSRVPPKVKNPKNYQERLPGVFPTEAEARVFLDAAILARIKNKAIPAGASFAHYAGVELASRLQDAKRKYGDNARATKHVTRIHSIDRRWFANAPWYEWRPAIIEPADLQRWFDFLRDEAVGVSGKPLSAGFIQSVRSLTADVFTRAGVTPDPTRDLRTPKPGTPNVHYLDVAAVRRFFADGSIPAGERLMVACGMGAGLRVGELLAIEPSDVHLDDNDPHVVIRYGGAHHGPPKGKRIRRVEMFGPGLGAWRLWMRDFYKGGRLVFAGPRGGYRNAWPEQFPGWAAAAGRAHMTSHIMRHTYAVAMLNGSWGYEPRPMEFVSRQLGHSSIAVTQRYYAAWEVGSAARDVRVMTGREARPARAMTALELFGFDASADASVSAIEPFLALKAVRVGVGRQATLSRETAENKSDPFRSDASTHHVLVRLAAEVLAAVQSGDPTATARAVELARAALALQVAPAGERVA